jgi:hypothetical protein
LRPIRRKWCRAFQVNVDRCIRVSRSDRVNVCMLTLFSFFTSRSRCLRRETLYRAEARTLIQGSNHQALARRLRVENRSTRFHCSNLIIRRSILTRETFDEALPAYSRGQDYDLWLRAKWYGLTGDTIVALRFIKASAGRLTARKMVYSHNANHWHFLRKGVSSLPTLGTMPGCPVY